MYAYGNGHILASRMATKKSEIILPAWDYGGPLSKELKTHEFFAPQQIGLGRWCSAQTWTSYEPLILVWKNNWNTHVNPHSSGFHTSHRFRRRFCRFLPSLFQNTESLSILPSFDYAHMCFWEVLSQNCAQGVHQLGWKLHVGIPTCRQSRGFFDGPWKQNPLEMEVAMGKS